MTKLFPSLACGRDLELLAVHGEGDVVMRDAGEGCDDDEGEEEWDGF